MSEIIRAIKLIKHTQIIEDPFKLDKPDNIYQAYMIGYNKAYKEIEDGLQKRKDQEDIITKGMVDAHNELVYSLKTGLETIIEEHK